MVVDTTTQGQLPFGHQTAETSKQAYRETRPMSRGRKALVREALRKAGTAGMTRYELSEELRLPIQTICGLVRPLVVAGDIVEIGDTRESPSGSASKIVRLAEPAEAK
jgi:hypothetical protein